MFSISIFLAVVIVALMVTLSENKKVDCFIGLNDNKVVYGTAGNRITCQLEKVDRNFFSTELITDNDKWLKLDPKDQTITGIPEKENVGQSNMSVMVRPHSCTSKVQWTVSVMFVVDLQQQVDSSVLDSCSNSPKVNRPVNLIQTRSGEVFKIDLDPLTFVDQEDGDTRDLKIVLKALFNVELSEDFWLKLDESSLALYGIPLKDDLDVFVVNLVSIDTCQQMAIDSIRLEVKDGLDEYNHEFIVYLTVDPSNFDLYKFVKGLLQWLDITDLKQIYVSNVDLTVEGYAISWVDKSLAIDVCERQNILDMYYQMANANGTVLEEFTCFFSPFFNVSSVYVIFKDVCNNSQVFVLSTNSDGKSVSSNDDDIYLFYILIPVAILTVVILMVIIILLVRRCVKRNRYVMNSEKPTFLMDRQPVIFQNEYNDEETALKPQIPIIIDHYDNDPSASMGVSEGRNPTAPPSYIPQSYNEPPQYRLPPPYHISGL